MSGVIHQESTVKRDLWDTEMEKDLRSSSHEVPQLSVSTTASTSDPSTGTYDTDTGVDFGLPESYTEGITKKHPHMCYEMLIQY